MNGFPFIKRFVVNIFWHTHNMVPLCFVLCISTFSGYPETRKWKENSEYVTNLDMCISNTWWIANNSFEIFAHILDSIIICMVDNGIRTHYICHLTFNISNMQFEQRKCSENDMASLQVLTASLSSHCPFFIILLDHDLIFMHYALYLKWNNFIVV